MTEKEILEMMEKQRQEDIEKDLPVWLFAGIIVLALLRLLFKRR